MGKIILVTGGSRSGKSSYALEVGQSVPGPRLFIATCPMTDDEMKTRIEAHQRERLPGNWKTIEEQTEIGKVLETVEESAVVLIDCLTLWVNNLMYRNEKEFENITEEDMEEFSSEVIRKCPVASIARIPPRILRADEYGNPHPLRPGKGFAECRPPMGLCLLWRVPIAS